MAFPRSMLLCISLSQLRLGWPMSTNRNSYLVLPLPAKPSWKFFIINIQRTTVVGSLHSYMFATNDSEAVGEISKLVKFIRNFYPLLFAWGWREIIFFAQYFPQDLSCLKNVTRNRCGTNTIAGWNGELSIPSCHIPWGINKSFRRWCCGTSSR